jgi:hypothetical protein
VALSSSGTGEITIYSDTTLSNLGKVRAKRFRADNKVTVDEDKEGVRMYRSARLQWSTSENNVEDNGPDVYFSRAASAVVKVNDALQLNPRSAPPVACGSAGTAGSMYFDSDSNSFCGCNGTAWAAGFGTAGPCS